MAAVIPGATGTITSLRRERFRQCHTVERAGATERH